MPSESIPARRRRRRFDPTVALAVTAVAAIGVAPLVGAATVGPVTVAAAEAAEPDDGGIRIHVAPLRSTVLDLGANIEVAVEIENATDRSLAAGAVQLLASSEAIDDVAELDAWRGEDSGGGEAVPTGVLLAETATAAIGPGTVELVSLTVPAASLADLTGAPVVGLAAELRVNGLTVAAGADAFATDTAPVAAPLPLAVVAPLTVPAGTAGLLTPEELTGWTGPTGLLTRQLDALAFRPVTIAIDPRIIASIRVLGTSAPESATAWLERLQGLPNEIFPLAYADADVAVQAQLDLPGLLAPTSFTDVLDPANFAAVDEGADDADGGFDDAEPTATETPAPPAEELPTTEALLAWPYTRTDIGWPADDTVATGDLGYLADAGLTTTILSAGNVEPTAEQRGAASTIDGSTAVVSDGRVTSALREAAEARTDTAWRSATGMLEAELALGADAVEGPVPTLLATLSRGGSAQADRVAATLDVLSANAWSQPAALSDAIGAPPSARTLVDRPEEEPRPASVQRLVEAETEVAAFATIVADPRLLTGPDRRELLAVLDVAWLADTEGWNGAVAEQLAERRSTLAAVSVVPSSPINVVSSETGVPTTILNALPYAATVVVDVEPSNGRLVVGDPITTTVEAESRSTVVVPVAAGVGNGAVTLRVSLASTDGVAIGTPVDFSVNVQADWEGLGAAILGIIVVTVFGIGLWRNIRRRRRQRAADAAETTASGDADGEASEAPASSDASEASDAPEASEAPASGPTTESRDG